MENQLSKVVDCGHPELCVNGANVKDALHNSGVDVVCGSGWDGMGCKAPFCSQ